MAFNDNLYDPKIYRYLEQLEHNLEVHPIFRNFREKFLNYLRTNQDTFASFTPEQLISQARSFEELVSMKDFLQEKFGNEADWWDFYHLQRKQLAARLSYYGENQFGLPINPRVADRQWGAGSQSEIFQRNLFSKKFTIEQLHGKKKLWSVGRGKIPVGFTLPFDHKPFSHTERYMAFDLETTGLLRDVARRTTGEQRGIYSIGWIGETGEESRFSQRILPKRAKGKWDGAAGTRPFFGHHIESEIIPRGQLAAQRLQASTTGFGLGNIWQTAKERDIVARFIQDVTERPGKALLGYNIERFDLPMMKLMAERHGLLPQWEAALQGRQIVDVAPQARQFLSQQLSGKYIGWQKSMVAEMGLHPQGWTLEAVAHSLGYEGKGIAHTPVEDAKMSIFVHETLKDQQKAAKIWKQGGEQRWLSWVQKHADHTPTPLSEFEDLLIKRGDDVFFDPQALKARGVHPSSLKVYEEELLSRLESTYGKKTFSTAAKTQTFSKTQQAIRKTSSAGVKYGLKAGKYAFGTALLGAVLPGEGVSNIVGAAGAIGAWKATGLGLKKLGSGGVGPRLLAGALAYAGIKGIAALKSPGRQVIEAGSLKYAGVTAEEEARINEAYYLPQLASQAGGAAAVEASRVRRTPVLPVYDILEDIEKDRKIDQEELSKIAYLASLAAENNALLQTLSTERARDVFEKGISWRDPARAQQITTTLQEGDQLGDFGWYMPSKKILAVNALVDPRNVGATLGMAYRQSDHYTDRNVAEFTSWAISPSKMSETTLHEGLHAVWDVDIDPAHKRAFLEATQEELRAGSGPNIDALAAKHPIYARQVARAKGGWLHRANEQAANWVANEVFAHRGAALRYNTNYDFGQNLHLDTIASQYVNWQKAKEGGMPRFVGHDVQAALSAGALTPARAAHHQSTAHRRMTPRGSGLMFDGFNEDGAAKGVRNIYTDFGSGFQGAKASGPISSALAGAGKISQGLINRLYTSAKFWKHRKTTGQNIFVDVDQTLLDPSLDLAFAKRAGQAKRGTPEFDAALDWYNQQNISNLEVNQPLISQLQKMKERGNRIVGWTNRGAKQKAMTRANLQEFESLFSDFQFHGGQKARAGRPPGITIDDTRDLAAMGTEGGIRLNPNIAWNPNVGYAGLAGAGALALVGGAGLIDVAENASASLASSGTSGTRVHGQPIDPEIMAFREEWIQDKDKRRQLGEMKDKAFAPYKPGDLEPWRIQGLGHGLAKVNIKGLRPHWEDADTLELHQPWYKPWKKDISVRLTGIDAPETTHEGMPMQWTRWHQAQPFGEEATKEVRKFAGVDDLELIIPEDPKKRSYDRYLGLVYRGGSNIPINLELVERGHAAALPWGEAGSDMLPRELFMQTEQEAVAQKKGMWQHDYWQRYLDISQGAQRRVTFTSFSDLERLASNLHLAAAESLMRSETVDYEPWMGRYVGSKLRFGRGPGLGPQKNIEGIHPGAPSHSLGTRSIQSHSDFGSGIVPGALKRTGKIILKNLQPAKRSSRYPLSPAGIEKNIKQWEKDAGLRGFITEEEAEDKAKEIIRNILNRPDPAAQKRPVSSLVSNVLGSSDPNKTPVAPPRQSLLQNLKLHAKSSSKKIPVSSPKDLSEIVEQQKGIAIPLKQWKNLDELEEKSADLIKKILDMQAERAGLKKLPPPILKRKHNVVFYAPPPIKENKFPGMPDDGLASNVREELTEFKKKFSSRWDPMRKLAVRLFGQEGKATNEQAFQTMLKSKSFTSAIKTAIKEKGTEIGRGKEGLVTGYMAKMSHQGKEYPFEFATKRAHTSEFLKKDPDIQDPVFLARQFQLRIKKEYDVLKNPVIGGSQSPSAYGMVDDVLVMEKFRGVEELGTGVLSKQEHHTLDAFMRRAHKEGYRHGDLHQENIVRVLGENHNPEIAILDWATVNKLEDPMSSYVWEKTKGYINVQAKNILGTTITSKEFAEMADLKRLQAHTIPGADRLHHLGMNNPIRLAQESNAISSASTIPSSSKRRKQKIRPGSPEYIDFVESTKLVFEHHASRDNFYLKTAHAIQEELDKVILPVRPVRSPRLSLYDELRMPPFGLTEGRSAAALRKQEIKHPSVKVPWETARNASRGHKYPSNKG